MLSRLCIEARHCFGDSPLTLESLGPVNFLFAANGSGKTTISSTLATQPDEKEARSNWSVGQTTLRIRVFNEEYKSNVLTESISGIFNLGEDSLQIQQEISNLTQEVRTLEHKRDAAVKCIGDEVTRTGLHGEIKRETQIAAEKLFAGHKRFSNALTPIAFSGFRKDKNKFLTEAHRRFRSLDQQNLPDIVAIEDLHARAQTLAAPSNTRQTLQPPPFVELLTAEEHEFLAREFSRNHGDGVKALFSSPEHQDWINAGRHFVHPDREDCPFCQQQLPSDFLKRLNEHFSGEFDTAVQRAKELKETAHARAIRIESYLQDLEAKMEVDAEIDSASINPIIRSLRTELAATQSILEEKLSHPTSSLPAPATARTVESLALEISVINAAILEYNSLILNREVEKDRLRDDTWYHLIRSSDEWAALKRYSGQLDKKQGKIEEKRKEADQAATKAKELRTRIAELHAKVTSTRQAAVRINEILKASGFTRFHLKEADETSGGYRLVRKDGSVAFNTLSEGEKSFISFLYFWESLFGSSSSDTSPEDVVVVLDDPISSMDSDILFIVASFVRDAAKHALSDCSNIRQLIVMTHNTQFHQEAAFETSSVKGKYKYFRLLKSNGDVTRLAVDGNVSRVKGNYSLLWDAVVEAASSEDSTDPVHVGLLNICRRIIEGYFKFTGVATNGQEFNASVSDKRVLSMFDIWANAGSHAISDDLDYSSNVTSTYHFLRLFRKFFVAAGQAGHFDLMIQASKGGHLLEGDGIFASVSE